MLIQDLRHACRRLRAAPALTVMAVLTLALGIGASTAIFTTIDALLLRPLPYRDPATLAEVWAILPGGLQVPTLRRDALPAWQDPSLFSVVEPHSTTSVAVTGDGEPESLAGAMVGGGLLATLGVQPRIGRALVADDARVGAPAVAMISERLWRRRFGGDPSAVGRSLVLDGRAREVVGVIPAAFNFPSARTDVWMPHGGSATAAMGSRVGVLVRLPPGTTVAGAQARADTIAAGLERERPVADGWTISVKPYRSLRVTPAVRRALFAMWGAVSLLLLVACANLAGLQLVQRARREREVALLAALGATRGRLVRQSLVESSLLALAGGGVGLTGALWAVGVIEALAPAELTFLRVNDLRVDYRALAFAAATSGVTVILFGLVPALRGSRAGGAAALGGGGRAVTESRSAARVRGAFVVVQVAAATVLLVGALLLARTFTAVTRIDPGFETKNLVAATLVLPRAKFPTRESQVAHLAAIVERVRALPQVAGASLTGGVPPESGGIRIGLYAETREGVAIDDEHAVMPYSEVDASFFSTIGIPIREGRGFTAVDGPGAERRIILSESFARRVWPGVSAVGRDVKLSPRGAWHTVVGVAGDVFQVDLSQRRGTVSAYFPATQATGSPFQHTLLVRTRGEPAQAVPAIKQQIWTVDPAQAVTRAVTMEGLYAEFFAAPRFYFVLMAAFAVTGMAIASLGLHGVLAFSVALRTREFGIRLAMGAAPRDVRRLALRSPAMLVGAGLACGLLLSAWLTRGLQAMLIGIERHDPAAYALTLLVIVGTAALAVWRPARRAARVDPSSALRSE